MNCKKDVAKYKYKSKVFKFGLWREITDIQFIYVIKFENSD